MDMKMTTWTHHSDRGWKTQKANSKICQSENVSENMQVDLTEDFSQAFPDTEYILICFLTTWWGNTLFIFSCNSILHPP